MSTAFGKSGPKNVEVLDHPNRRKSSGESTRPPPPDYNEGSKPTIFGEAGPKHVEALAHPTRRPSNIGPSTPATVHQRRRTSLDSEEAEAEEEGDHFEMMPTPSQLPPEARTWPASRLAISPQLSGSVGGTGKGIDRWNSSINMGSSSVSTSQRFAQPLVSEGQGSVFPVGLSMSKRRALEVEIIKRFDRREVNTHVGEFWFIIDAAWMSSWIHFVLGKSGPPGPISNNNLFLHYSPKRRESMLVNQAASSRGGVMASRPDLRLKEGLQKVRDYRAVHPLVWYLFREIYAADDAPEICRWKVDIYQAEVQATRKFKFCEDTHTKAVYELRKFCGKIKDEMSS
eukprot:g7550.t1